MTPGRFDDLRELFVVARSLDPSERAAFLDEKCRLDPDLRRDVESLLSHDGNIPRLLNATTAEIGLHALAMALEIPPESELASGARIGRFLVVKKIGSGGYGDVYLAEQHEPIHRRLALKVIKLGMDTRAVVARFQQERQALAVMDHPSIAKVLDAGATPAGRPYFVMEYVPGVPITEFSRDRSLELAARLKLFIEVCDAVQHAHRKGIVHRDIKPSNILAYAADDSAVVKVIDFGIAKALVPLEGSPALVTQDSRIGTPAYMSPEQTRGGTGAVDTRTDVYALGVLLYELVTDHVPFEPKAQGAGGVEEVLHAIQTETPRAPSSRSSSWARQVRGDLDWIILKALEKDLDRRYGSASELAADVARFLKVEPVTARPPSAAYRLKKLIRRNKAASLAIAATSLSLVIALIVVGRTLSKATDENLLRLEAWSILFGAFRPANPIDPSLPPDAAPVITVREALRYLDEETRDRYTNKPLFRAELDYFLGKTYAGQGDLPKAREHLLNALKSHRELLGPRARETIATTVQWGGLQAAAGEYAESEGVLRNTFSLAKAHLGTRDRITLEAEYVLAELLKNRQKFAESEPLYRDALDGLAKTVGDEDPLTTSARGGLGHLLTLTKKFEEAEPLLRLVVESRRAKLGPDHPDTLDAETNLAGFYYKKGDGKQALPLQARVLEAYRERLGNKHPITIDAIHNLAVFSEARNDGFVVSESLSREAVQLAVEVFGGHNGITALYRASHGQYLSYSNQLPEAREQLLEAYTDMVAAQGPSNPYANRVARDLAEVYRKMNLPDSAAEWERKGSDDGSSENH